MKKIIALLLLLTMAISMTATALATGQQTGTTTLTAVVPESDYTIHVPADTTLEYGSTNSKALGSVYISDAVNVNGSVWCEIYGTALKNESNYITVSYYDKLETESQWHYTSIAGESRHFTGQILYSSSSDTYTSLDMKVQVESWEGAVPGTYTATITYNFSIAD